MSIRFLLNLYTLNNNAQTLEDRYDAAQQQFEDEFNSWLKQVSCQFGLSYDVWSNLYQEITLEKVSLNNLK